MRFFARVLVCVAVVAAVAGCNPVNKHYFQEGIGSSLPPADIEETTTELQQYVNNICAQAGLGKDGGGGCGIDTGTRSTSTWHLFVQAGMNDIDRRCDAYLVWLDNIRRSESPILRQISDTNVATQLVLTATSAGVVPMALVATALGYAADTVTNVNSRLILTVNHSTVQAVVLGKQKDYRKELLGDGKTSPAVIIDNRPAAIYALRNYMRLCMPMTIETEINNTIVAYQSGGIDAYKKNPMITAASVSRPLTADEKITKPPRPPIQLNKAYLEVFDQRNAETMTPERYQLVQDVLCVPNDEVGKVGDQTKALIKMFEMAYRGARSKEGKLDTPELNELFKRGSCVDKENKGRNYYERIIFTSDEAGRKNTKDLVEGLRKYKAGESLPLESSLNGSRATIKKVREELGGALSPLPGALTDQVTKDLYETVTSKR